MAWEEPDDYEPREDLGPYLTSIGPKMNTPEMGMVLYWQWVHCSLPIFTKTKEKAWADADMSPELTQLAFARRLIPKEIYDLAVARAEGGALVG